MCAIKDRVEALLIEQGDRVKDNDVSRVAQTAAASVGDKVIAIRKTKSGGYRIETTLRGQQDPIWVEAA